MKKIYWTRLSKVTNSHGPVRKDLRKLHNICRGLYKSRKELIENADQFNSGASFDDGTCWYEVIVKVKVEIIK